MNTVFRCDITPDPSTTSDSLGDAARANRKDELGYTVEDEAWKEYELPIKKLKKRLDVSRTRSFFTHRTTIPLDVRLQSGLTSDGSISTENASAIKHYLDAEALAPVISATISDDVSFPLLQLGNVAETEQELKRARWDVYGGVRQQGWCFGKEHPSRKCWESNGGGGSYHAARMWQSKVEKQKERDTRSKTEQESEAALVVQA